MSITYKVKNNYSHRGTTSFDIKKGEEFSEEDLIEKFGSEGVFKYMRECCGFSKVIEIVEFSVPGLGINESKDSEDKEVETQEVETQEVEIMFLTKEDLSKKKKVIFKKDSKISIEELKENYSDSTISKYIKEKKLMEIKVV